MGFYHSLDMEPRRIVREKVRDCVVLMEFTDTELKTSKMKKIAKGKREKESWCAGFSSTRNGIWWLFFLVILGVCLVLSSTSFPSEKVGMDIEGKLVGGLFVFR